MPLPIGRGSLGAVALDLDRVARVEVAEHVDDPHRQQARAALAQRAGRARVHQHLPVAGLGVLQPQLEARVARRARREARADGLARQRRLERVAGAAPLAITVAIPAAVAISAATTFERIPPEPSGDPACADVQLVQALEVGRPP